MSIFSKIPVRAPKLHPHDLSHTCTFSTQFGRLTPHFVEKVIPGDIIPTQVMHQEQFAPLSTKHYQAYRIKTETYFVPSRVLWDDFGKFFVAEQTTYIHPFVRPDFVCYYVARRLCELYPELKSSNDAFNDLRKAFFAELVYYLFGPSGVFHYLYGSFFGVYDAPLQVSSVLPLIRNGMSVRSDGFWSFSFPDFPAMADSFDFLRIYAYYRVIAEYYLDENLQKDLMDYIMNITDEIPTLSSGNCSTCISNIIKLYFTSLVEITNDTVQVTTQFLLRNINLLQGFVHRCWPKDYFSGSLPFKDGGSVVDIPLQGVGQLELQISDSMTQYLTDNTAINNLSYEVAANQDGVPAGYTRVYLKYQSSEGGNNFNTTHQEPLQTSVTVGGIHTTIEDFRTAYQVAEWIEKNQRGGTRYKEQIFSHFGIRTKDSRLDRPEFIVGSTDSVNYGNVFTTYQDNKGNGVPAESVSAISAGGRSRSGVYRVTEHGYIITMYSIYPRAQYAQGLYRQGLELDKFDYFWPEFQHLGEQEVFAKEVLSTEAGVFGYNPRYSQYKCRVDTIHGDFVCNLPTFTNYRVIPAGSQLNAAFISIIPQFSQLSKMFNYVDVDYDKIYVTLAVLRHAVRPIDYYGVPRLFN